VVNHVPDLYDGVMRFGGSQDVPVQNPNGTATVEWSIAGSPWMPLPPMPKTDGAPDGTRTHASALTLPTGAVLVLGGQNNNGQAMVSPLIFAEGAWHVDAPNWVYNPRMYHSAAVLLDDGTVAIGGGDLRAYDYEVYRPYYTLLPASHKPVNLTFPVPPFFNAQFDAWQLEYGTQYEIHCDPILAPGVAVQKAVLIPPGSATHGFDMHHRYVELKTEVNNTNEVHFEMPSVSEEGVAPRGLYRLWLVTNTGAVSNALWVVIR
jgi:hypothetical protein